MRLANQLSRERALRRWSQGKVAAGVGISRQSYAAIEAGSAVPSTEIALRLARLFSRSVEDLFRLPDAPVERVPAGWIGEGDPLGRRVRLSQVGGRLLAGPVGESERPNVSASGLVVEGKDADVLVQLLPDRPPVAGLSVVGCDPAFGIVAETLRRERSVDTVWIQRGSRAAIDALARGEAHVAGAHLREPQTGETNGPWVRNSIPFPCTRILFAEWEQGILVSTGNPIGITGVADLTGAGIRFLNREPGSGSRSLLDEALNAAGVPSTAISGYSTSARGHLAVAEAISAGLADAAIGIRAAGAAFGLTVLPMRTEPYELIIPNHFLDLPAVGALLDILRRPGTRAQVEALQGYDGARMGLPV